MSDDKSESKAEPLRNSVVQEGLKFDLFRESARVVGLAEDIGEVMVPEQVEGRPVTVVAKGAFRNAATVRKVTLPRTVTLLGANAFENCSSLTNVELPSDLETINASVFLNCARLETVRLPAALERIASQAFSGCTSLRDLSHFVATGPKSERRVQRNLVEHSLPVTLSYIGEAAFSGCEALRKIVIPYQVTSIPARAFENCSRLGTVWLHSGIAAVGERAFSGCTELKELRLPRALTSLGEGAFDLAIRLITEPGSPARSEAEKQGFSTDICEVPGQRIISSLGDDDGITVSELLTRPELLRDIQERYEIRPPVDEVERDVRQADDARASSSRFTRVGNVYRSEATSDEDADVLIAMVGDIMCGFRQQRSAVDDRSYDFEASFEYVHELLSQSDLAVGNLESMVSEAYPFMHERLYVDDRPNLNSPHEFLSAVRNGGFDAVMSAQNHMYDTGAKGILQTLDALNHANLIHGGLYADRREPRHTMFEIKGMHIAIVAFLDPARQRMKQANFTEEGLEAMASFLDDASIRDSITEAKNAGAEFVLAYCHWGSEYTETITARQARFAQMVADAGADYIFGSHSHCPQHYSIHRSEDGRSVPVVFSGGNFLSDIQRRKPITQDTFVSVVRLVRNGTGQVVIAEDGYVPCRILDRPETKGYSTVVPCERLTEGGFNYSPLDAREDIERIAKTMGTRYRQLRIDGFTGIENVHRGRTDTRGPEELVRRFSVREPSFLPVPRRTDDSVRPKLEYQSIQDRWSRPGQALEGEAVVLCAGSLMYDRTLDARSDVGSAQEFRPMFKEVRRILMESDLTIGSLGAIVADDFPPMRLMGPKVTSRHYVNARSEYLDGVHFGGFDCLALANPFNLDAGVRGVGATEEAVLGQGMVPSGLGRRKTPVFEVNGIRIGVFSYTLDLYKTRAVITREGADALLGAFHAGRIRDEVASTREHGAEFLIGYLDCRSSDSKHGRAARLRAAKQFAELGMDVVVCTLPPVLSKFYRHETTDGRSVPIATSLGTFAAGRTHPSHSESAVIKLILRRSADGSIEFEDSFIPFARFDSNRGALPVLAPLNDDSIGILSPDEIKVGRERALDAIGPDVSLDRMREEKISSSFVANLSPSRVSEVLGADFSEEHLDELGDALGVEVPGIVTRKGDIREGSIVVLVRHTSSRRELDQTTAAEAKALGAICVVAEEYHDDLPCLRVQNAWSAYRELMSVIRSRYSPLTVAITGTAGKTTTKELMSRVFDSHYTTMHIAGNNNTLTTASLVLQKLTPSYEAYIQEVNGGTPGSARQVSRLIRPDIAVITSISDGHLDQMGSIERVIQGKMQITEGLRPGGVLIVNNDNEYLKEQDPKVRTVRYGIEDPSCDFWATEVQSVDGQTSFRIVSSEGTYQASLKLRGTHNVGNALAVFAAAREAGIPPHKILAGLARHEASSVRQNLVHVGGVQLLVDAYNSNLLSMMSALDTLNKLQVVPGGRRLVVMGDMGEQGDKVRQNHEDVGVKIANSNIDLALTFGVGARYTSESILSRGGEARHYSDIQLLITSLRDELREGDAILFKAAGSVKLAERVIYPLFGRVV